MKVVEAAETVISNKVRATFQHPSGYTTVLHKEDNRLYLYEQRHMSVVGISKTAVSSAIELLAFSSNFNLFYVVSKEGNHQRQLRVFQLNEMGQLASESMEFRKNITIVEPHYLCMAPLQTKDEEGNEAELLICLDANTYSCVTNIGRMVKQEDLLLDGQNIKASKIKHIKEGTFFICSENLLLSANIDFQRCQLREQLKLQDNIRDLFIEGSRLYIAVHTVSHKMHIVSSFGGRFRICFDFSTQSLNVSDACFFRPGVNTSATNKYKDRLFLVFQVLSNAPEKLQERKAKRNAEFINMSANYSPNNLYFYQFRESFANRGQQFPTLKAFHQFCIQGVGKIRSLFTSSLVQNSVLALNHENKATSYNLIRLLSHSRLDKEWIYLSFKFQGCPSQNSILYEQREDQFESDLASKKAREISQEELNDWSDSVMSPSQIKSIKKYRIKCLDF